MAYPPADRLPTIDKFQSGQFGPVEIPNPYSWLEDLESTKSKDFISAQNVAFDSYIGTPELAEPKNHLMDTLRRMHGLAAMISAPIASGNYYYYRVAGRGTTFPVTFRSRKKDFLATDSADKNPDINDINCSNDVAVPQPEVFHDEGADGAAVISSGFSADDKFWAYSTSLKGSEWSTIHVKDVKTKARLPDQLERVKFTAKSVSISWLGYLGFFYQYWPDNENNRNPELRFHQIGDSQERDVVVHSDPENPSYTFAAKASEDGRFVFLSIFKASRSNQLWAARVQGKKENAALQLNFDIKISDNFEAERDYVGMTLASYVLWSTEDNGQVSSLSLDGMDLVARIVGSVNKVVKIARSLPNGNILVVHSIDVHDELRVFSASGQDLGVVDSPILTILDVTVDSITNDIFLLESTFYQPPSVWRTRMLPPSTSSSIFSVVQPLKIFPWSLGREQVFSTRQVFYESLDGTKIPMFLTSQNSRPITPATPILLYTYGAFGVSVIPHFRADFMTFLLSFQGVLVIANVRGGGEYGHTWYAAARKDKRQRLFEDVISGIQYLRRELGSQDIILMGESMGGLNAASVMVRQPDLLKGVIINVGPSDILRRKRFGQQDRGSDDVGDPAIPEEFDFLIRWAPLENIKVGEKYPPVLLTAGDADDIVPPIHSCKMAAALQYATKDVPGANNVSLSIEKDAGHGANNSALQKTKSSIGRWLWVSKALGLKIYPTAW